MCAICGIPNVLPCNCVSQQPFCDQCADDTKCLQEMDSQCVIYHQNTSVPSKLRCLNMPNGSSVESILEKIDSFVCNAFNIPFIAVDSPSIDFTQSGNAGHVITADVNISPNAGNLLSILSNGLYVPNTNDGKVKVNASTPARYLEDAVIGATDGCTSISVETDGSGLLVIHPTLNIDCLSALLCADAAFTLCVGNSLCSSSNFVNCIETALCGNAAFQQCVIDIIGPVGGNITANNGLTANTSTNVQLGGTLIKNTTIDQAAFQLNFENGPVQVGDQNTALSGVLMQVIDVAGAYHTLVNNRKQGQLSPTASRVTNENFLVIDQLASYTGTLLGTHQDAVDAQFWLNSNFALNLNASRQTSYAGIYATMIKSGSGNATGNFLTSGYFGCYPADSGNIEKFAAAVFQGPQDPPPAFGGNFTGTITNYYDIFLGDTAAVYGGATITNRFAIYQEGTGDISRFFGPVQNASSSVQFTSDARVKENIVDFTPGLDVIEQVQAHNFNYTYNKDKTVAGVVAQELEAIFPEAVHKENFTTPSGEVFTDFRIVDQNKLFYAMLNAIKELSTKVKALEAK